MPELKNTFIASKMNKDIDARIMPNNEYRDALNIAVSRSEGDDVGALENIKGNNIFEILNNQGNEDAYGWQCIGYCIDEARDKVYVFLTNFLDGSDVSNVSSTTTRFSRFPDSSQNPNYQSCQILEINLLNQAVNIVCQGDFLNFSKENRVEAVLIEDLLFWTDNRNQPRKINVVKAVNGTLSYMNEDQVSLAKYYPYQPIELHTGGTNPVTTMKNKTNKLLPYSVGAVCFGQANYNQVNATQFTIDTTYLDNGFQQYPSEYLSDPNARAEFVTIKDINIAYINSLRVTGFQINGNIGTITIDGDAEDCAIVDDFYNNAANPNAKFYFHFENPDYEDDWPGDEEFLKERFVRFSYRFKFDDDEYSLTAPFTQACFIPEQFGHLLDYSDAKIKNSQHIEFMKNLVDTIMLRIPLPVNSADLFNDFHITEMDIIMKEDKSVNMKILDTIKSRELVSAAVDTWEYEYQSKKPIEVLPESENVRVYDKVPIKAKSLVSVGNRVVFGNYVDRANYEQQITYKCDAGLKRLWDAASPFNTVVGREYPLSSLKQNRTYQVGFVLADRYGRQTDVILSSYDVASSGFGGDIYGGSTLYHDYYPATATNPATWFGDSLKVLLENPIETSNSRYTPISNPLGWYSYKIVVKQQEQDFYNIFLPGVNPLTPQTTVVYNNNVKETVQKYIYTPNDSKVQIELSGDNVNKVPRSLINVGPLDKKFAGSDVSLYPRVNPKNYKLNSQAFPGDQTPFNADVVSTIAAFNDYDIDTSEVWDFYNDGFPLQTTSSLPVASITSTSKERMGPDGYEDPANDLQAAGGYVNARYQTLAVYETSPVKSEIDIFWETTSAGLISELNNQITDDPGSGEIGGIEDALGNNTFFGDLIDFSFNEVDPTGTNVTQSFQFVDNAGAIIINPQIVITSVSTVNGLGQVVAAGNGTGILEAIDQGNGFFILRTTDENQIFRRTQGANQSALNEYTITIAYTSQGVNSSVVIQGELTNSEPFITLPNRLAYDIGNQNPEPWSENVLGNPNVLTSIILPTQQNPNPNQPYGQVTVNNVQYAKLMEFYMGGNNAQTRYYPPNNPLTPLVVDPALSSYNDKCYISNGARTPAAGFYSGIANLGGASATVGVNTQTQLTCRPAQGSSGYQNVLTMLYDGVTGLVTVAINVNDANNFYNANLLQLQTEYINQLELIDCSETAINAAPGLDKRYYIRIQYVQ